MTYNVFSGTLNQTHFTSLHFALNCPCNVFGRPFVKRFALCYRSVVCLSVLSVCNSVTLVHCGQTVEWIKMKIGVEVGLGPGHTVLDGDPAPLPKRAQLPIFDLCLLWPNGWMNQDATWYDGRPRLRQHRARWGPSSTPKGTAQFSAHVCCGQTAGWIKMPLGAKVGLGPGHIVLHGDPALPLPKGAESHPIFGPCLLWPNGRPSQPLLSTCIN